MALESALKHNNFGADSTLINSMAIRKAYTREYA